MYAKIFTSIWDGSLFGQLEASAVLMACVTLCNAQGILDMTPESISGRIGWPLEFVRKGIQELEKPDPRSRTAEDDGRRFARLDEHRDWGWLIVNYEKYRTLCDPEAVREQTKIRVRKHREQRNGVKRCVTVGNALKRQEEEEAEEGKRKTVTSTSSTANGSVTPADRVMDHWRTTMGHPKAKLDPKRKRIIATALKAFTPEQLCDSISGYRKSKFHMGENEQRKVFDDIELLLRDAKHVEQGIELGSGQKSGGDSGWT